MIPSCPDHGFFSLLAFLLFSILPFFVPIVFFLIVLAGFHRAPARLILRLLRRSPVVNGDDRYFRSFWRGEKMIRAGAGRGVSFRQFRRGAFLEVKELGSERSFPSLFRTYASQGTALLLINLLGISSYHLLVLSIGLEVDA